MADATLRQLFLNYLVQGCVLGLAALALLAAAPRLRRRYAPQWFSRVWVVLAVLLVLPLGSVPAWRQNAPVQLQTPVSQAAAVQMPEETVARPVRQPLTLPDPLTLLADLWLAGAGLTLAWRTGAYLVWRRRALRASRPAAGSWAEVWGDACAAVPLRRTVPLRQSAAVGSPVTAGLLWPVVLVPEQDPGAQAARMMLLHERTHLQRRDLARKALLLAARCLHWYNPAVALLVRRAARDMEAACDAQVVAGHTACWRGAYGDALLDAARMGRAPAFTTGFALGKQDLKFRFARLWDCGPRRRGYLALVSVGLCAALCAGLIACTPAESGTLTTPEAASAAAPAAVTPAPAAPTPWRGCMPKPPTA